MEINVPLILIGLLFSGVGYVYFSYGKRQSKAPVMIFGIVLMVYPYFVSSPVWSGVIGVLLTLFPILLKWF